MNLKKSIFSYIIWAAFAFLCCISIVAVLNTAEVKDMLNWPKAGIIGAACGYLVLTAAVFFGLRTLGLEIGKRFKDRERLERAAFIALPAAVLIGVAVYLVLYMIYHVPLTLEDDSFYRQAVVSAGKSVPFAVHGASWLYPHLLHVMLLVFGNTPFAGVVLQMILFFICLLLLYIGMQSFTGTVSAAVSMAAFGFLPVSLRFVFSLTPELFCLALYLVGFCLCGKCFKRFKKRSYISPAQYFFVFLAGIYTGFLIYLDLYSISLFFFFAILYSLDREKIRRAAGVNLTVLFGAAIGFGLSAAAAAWMGRMSVSQYLRELFERYMQNAAGEAEAVKNALLLPDTTVVGSLLAISFAFFVIPGFCIWKRNQNSAFILNLFLVYALSVFHVFYLNMQAFMTFSWCILAGAGFYGVIRPPELNAQDEAENDSENDSGNDSKNDSGNDMDQEISDSGNAREQSGKAEGTEKTDNFKPAPGEPFHNPLPLPKRKIRPRADFHHQVEETDMKFDIEVADNDDFDV